MTCQLRSRPTVSKSMRAARPCFAANEKNGKKIKYTCESGYRQVCILKRAKIPPEAPTEGKMGRFDKTAKDSLTKFATTEPEK